MGLSCFDDDGTSNCNLDNRRTTSHKYLEKFARCDEWHQIVIRRFLRDESGNIESAMVLIPLIFLFLCSIQLISAVYIRNSDQSFVQSQASIRAISGAFEDTDQIIRIPSRYTSESQNVLVVSKRRNIPLLVPGLGNFLGRELQSEAIGVAVIENQP